MEKEVEAYQSWQRNRFLAQLHSDRVETFTNTIGVGWGRMATLRDAEILKTKRIFTNTPLPGHRSESDRWDGKQIVVPSNIEMMTLHDVCEVDFVNPAGFGLIETKRQVVGFQSHGFGSSNLDSGKWTVETIELVGLLMHPKPAVYVTTRLPVMDELKTALTRDLDDFETAGLERLKGGDDLLTRKTSDPSRIRMLGSIRNGKTCVQCHGGVRGDLLGAFSYILSEKK